MGFLGMCARAVLLLASSAVWISRLDATDCNLNGKDDAEDITALEPGFGEPVLIAEVKDPSALVGLDADGDGDTDLIAASATTRTITVILNQGGGRFSQGATLPAGIAPRRLVAGDFDGDRRSDIVVVGTDTQDVTILRNAGGGAFEAPRTLHFDGITPADVAVNDLDRDGDLDLAITGENANHLGSVSIFLNDGKGGFAQGPVISTREYSPVAVVAEDLDLDGDVDLVTANFPEPLGLGSDLSVLLNSGALDFQPARGVTHAGGIGLIAGRVDDNSRCSLLVIDFSGATCLSGFGDGSFFFRWNVAVPTSQSVLAGLLDLNGDGLADLALAYASSDGCRPLEGLVTLFVVSNDKPEESATVKLGTDPRGLVTADMDGDGHADLAVAGATPAGVFLLQGKLVTRSKDCNTNGIPDECDVQLRDCNLNGVPDECDVVSGSSRDCNGNLFPDECERDCNASGMPDDCDIASGAASDCNRNGVPDACELATNDRDENGTPDDCDIAAGSSPDCNSNGVPDSADLLVTPRFSAADGIASAWQIQAALSVDLDGDGDLDVAVTNRNFWCSGPRGSLSVLRNVNHGKFDEVSQLPTDFNPSSIAAGDLDGDGDLDLAVGHADFDYDEGVVPFTGIALFWNRGNGLFDAGPWFADKTDIRSILVEDLDGDGDADIVARTSARTVVSFTNVGQGSFQPGMLIFAGPGLTGLASGDIDEDGDVDLVSSLAFSGNFGGALITFLNDGQGRFDRPRGIDTIFAVWSVVVNDLDGDAHLDLLASKHFRSGSPASDTLVFWNAGRGVFDVHQDLDFVQTGYVSLVADMNGDDKPDLVYRDESVPVSTILVVLNRGHRDFGDSFHFAAPAGSTLLAGDWNGDGNTDVLFQGNTEVSIAWNHGGGRFVAPQGIPTHADLRGMDAADLDGDGAVDMVTVNEFSVGLLWNDGGGSFQLGERIPVGSGPAFVLAMDLNGDGRTDLVTANSLPEGKGDDNVSVMLNAGGTVFERPRNFAIPKGPAALAAADVDGDGDIDLAVANPDSLAFSVLKNRGDGSFDRAVRFVTNFPPGGLAFGDLDDDGDPDAALLAQPVYDGTCTQLCRGGLVIFANVGQGTFSTEATLGNEEWPLSVATGNLDGDGRTDIVTASLVTAGVSARFQRAGGGFSPPVLFATGAGASSATLADMDRDGNLDIVASGFPLPGPAVLLNRGGARFSPPILLDPGAWSTNWTAADFTGDGLLDLAAPSFSGNEIIIIDNLSAPVSLDADHDGIPDECESGGAKFIRGDSNGDGNLDLSDAVATLRFLFAGGAALRCDDAADANDDGRLDITDAVATLLHLFAGAGPLPEPAGACGRDPTSDALRCVEGGRCNL